MSKLSIILFSITAGALILDIITSLIEVKKHNIVLKMSHFTYRTRYTGMFKSGSKIYRIELTIPVRYTTSSAAAADKSQVSFRTSYGKPVLAVFSSEEDAKIIRWEDWNKYHMAVVNPGSTEYTPCLETWADIFRDEELTEAWSCDVDRLESIVTAELD